MVNFFSNNNTNKGETGSESQIFIVHAFQSVHVMDRAVCETFHLF